MVELMKNQKQLIETGRSRAFAALATAACAGTLLFASPARGVLVELDTTAEYTNGTGTATTPGTGNFNESGATSYLDALTWSGSNGVGAVAGRLDVNTPTSGGNTDTTATYAGAGSSFDLTIDSPHTTSVFFLTSAATTITGVIPAQVGFSELNNQPFLTGVGQDWVTAAVVTTGTGTFNLRGRFANNGTQGENNATANFSLASSTWYKLTGTFTDAGSSFNFSAALDNYGADGTAYVSTLASIVGGSLAQTSLSTTDTEAFGGFRVNANTTNQIVALDNFELIPEPSTGLMVLSGLGMLTLFRRRSA